MLTRRWCNSQDHDSVRQAGAPSRRTTTEAPSFISTRGSMETAVGAEAAVRRHVWSGQMPARIRSRVEEGEEDQDCSFFFFFFFGSSNWGQLISRNENEDGRPPR